MLATEKMSKLASDAQVKNKIKCTCSIGIYIMHTESHGLREESGM